MSAVPDQSGSIPPTPLPLGQLLIERGFLSEEQLASALAQQAQSGSPLGEVLVELGYVPAALIAQALATQHGGLLKTEYGFATGFMNRPSTGVPATPPPMSAAEPPRPTLPAGQVLRPLRAVSEEPEAVPAPQAPVAAATPPAAAPQPPALEPADVHTEELEAELTAARIELETLRSRTDELAQERDEAFRRADEASQRAETLERARDDLEAELARAREAEAEPAVEPPDAAHLAFVGSAEGYSLVECPGPPPAVDTIVELPEESGVRGRHLVVRVGRANVPGVDSRCAFLLSVD